MKYAVLLSCRNEEKHIGEALSSVLSQSVSPELVVVVDDFSTDKTTDIVSKFSVILISTRNPRCSVRGVNQALALNAGLTEIYRFVPDWDYVLKIDADTVLSEKYVESLILKYVENKKLGICSGNPQDEKIWRGRASDGAKVFSRACLDSIGFFPLCNAFDTLMILRAKHHGWLVESFTDVKYTQTRTMRREKLSRWVLSGRSRYYLGFPVWHTFLIAVVYAKQKPYFIGSFSMFLAHFFTSLGNEKRPWGKSFYTFVNAYAMEEFLDRVKLRML